MTTIRRCCTKEVCCCEPRCKPRICCDTKICCEPNCTPCNPSSCNPCIPCCTPILTDCLAQQLECLWKQTFCDALILPQIGFPSCGDGVMTLTHTLKNCCKQFPRINGLCTKSPLANNATYTVEITCCRWLNLYSIPLPNVAGTNGCKSSSEVYEEALIKLGISVDKSNLIWKGICPSILLVSSKAIGMDPCDFTRRQIAAIKIVLEYY